jgi:hypothetical protein
MNALTDEQMKAIYAGFAKAGLNGFRIVALHIEPPSRSTGTFAARDATAPSPAPTNLCHSQQLPSGGYVINCDPQ